MGVTVTTCTSQTQHRCSTEEVLLSSLIQYSSVSVTGYCVVICVPIGVCQCCKYAFFVRWSCVYQCFPVIIQYLCAASSVERKKNVAPILTSASSRKNKTTKNCHLSCQSDRRIGLWSSLNSHGRNLVEIFALFCTSEFFILF